MRRPSLDHTIPSIRSGRLSRRVCVPSFSLNNLSEEVNPVSPQTNARNFPLGEYLGVAGRPQSV